MRFVTDSTWNRTGESGRVLLAGSPLRVFRLSPAGAAVCAAIESGDAVAPSKLVDRLLDAGAIHPLPQAATTFTHADVTVVTPQRGGTVRGDRTVTVDDGSTPPIAGASMRLDTNRGPAAARNAGCAVVSTPLVAFVDADVTLPHDRNWLDALIAHFDDNRVGLVAPRVVGDPTASLDLGDEPARIRAGSRVSYVPAAAILVRAEAFDDVGGFDEGLRFGEDVDFVWRLDQAGWRCRYVPDVTVHHAPRSSWRARLRQQAGYGSSAAPLAQRHPRLLAPIRLNRWMAAGWTVAGLGHPLVAAACVVGNGVDVARLLPDVPPRDIARLTGESHLAIARQLAATVRRIWWPVVAIGSLVSKRMRWIALAAALAAPRAIPTDVAYGWGVWREAVRRREFGPLVPALSAWPPARRRAASSPISRGRPGG